MGEQISASDPADPQSSIQRQHLRGSSLMVVGRVIAMVLNLVVQVAAVRYLGKSDFGALAYGLAAAALATNVALWGQDQSIARFLPRYEREGRPDLAKGVVGVGFLAVLMTGTLIAAVVALSNAAGFAILSDSEAASVVAILIFMAPVVAMDELFHALFAVWSRPRAIFWRRHVATPLLRLASVLAVIVLGAGVQMLAAAYLLSGLVGLGIYLTMATQLKSERQHFRGIRAAWRWRELVSFSLPVHLSSLLTASREPLLVIILGAFWSTVEVASYRAVVPFAMINLVGIQSFRLLYLPAASRLFASDDKEGVREMYWRSAAWLAVGTFPVFVMTFSLAGPLTRVLLGDDYADSAASLAMLSAGFYFSATLGLNSHTLRASGQVRLLIVIDVVAWVAMLVVAFATIPSLGDVGVVIATLVFVVAQNGLTQYGLARELGSLRMPTGMKLMYGSIAGSALFVAAVQVLLDLRLVAGIFFAACVSIGVIRLNRSALALAETLPELRKIPLLGRLT